MNDAGRFERKKQGFSSSRQTPPASHPILAFLGRRSKQEISLKVISGLRMKEEIQGELLNIRCPTVICFFHGGSITANKIDECLQRVITLKGSGSHDLLLYFRDRDQFHQAL